MRVLLVCAAFPPYGKGGGPAASELIALALVSRGVDVRVLTVGDDVGDTLQDGYELRVIGSLNVYWNYWRANPLPAKLMWHTLETFNPWAFWRMRAEVGEYKPDIVMTVSIENINVATWVAARLAGKPIVHVTQSFYLLCWRGQMFRRGANCCNQCRDCKLATFSRQYLTRLVDGVIGETQFVLDAHLKRGLFKRAINRVIPGAVLPSSFVQQCRDDHLPLRVGYIGLHDPIKGIETLAKAATQLTQSAIEFKIAGNGDENYTKHLKNIFPRHNTSFHGWVKAADFYREVDIVVVPSIMNEVFGRVSVEPLAYGVPVIVSRSGGLPENVIEGESGLTFAPGDHFALASHLALLSQDRAHLS
jgi:glycosyltransferase involved in cell wall biosynthesis